MPVTHDARSAPSSVRVRFFLPRVVSVVMTLAVTLLHISIVSNAYSCGWSRSWKNSVVNVELQVRGSVNTLTQVHSALAGCNVRNLWLHDKVTCVQPSSPPELSPSATLPSREFQPCSPSTS